MTITTLNSSLPTNAQNLIDMLLENRGFTTDKQKRGFLQPLSPFTFTPKQVGIDSEQMKKAVHLIHQAKKEKWKVIVFGDYDCDGICATTILWETLYEMGIHAMPFIPSRDRHGYGLSMKALDDILEEKEQRPQLLISVDNGIVAHAPFERLQKEGVHTILTDHHQPEKTLPPADAVVHTTQLCGTTVAWMLAHELNAEKANTMLDLCAVATIADQVPLMGANRSFAKFGIEALRNTSRAGLQALIDLAAIDKKTLDTYGVNYAIAPRINAMGRIGSAMDALRLLCSKKRERALQYASLVHGKNTDRQEMTVRMIEIAKEQQERWRDERIIVVESDQFHEGVIGLVASKLTEEFGKPAVVIAVGSEQAKGSARSVNGVNITDLLREAREYLLDIGGHPMAAGFSLLKENVEQFMNMLYEKAKGIDIALLQKKIVCECILPWKMLTMETLQAIESLAPFGTMNMKPVFFFKEGVVVQTRAFGREQQYVKYYISDPSHPQLRFEALNFTPGGIEGIREGDKVNIVATIDKNTWNGRTTLQLRAQHIQLAQVVD